MDTSPVSATAASAIPSDALLALNALLIMAHVHGVAASGKDLLHRFSANGKDLNQEEWLLAARYLGLKVRAVSRSVSRLHLLALPAVVWQPDGQHFILARVDDGQFLIQDLAAGKPLLLSLADFAARFSGQLILVPRAPPFWALSPSLISPGLFRRSLSTAGFFWRCWRYRLCCSCSR